jgi:hypothetical protein
MGISTTMSDRATNRQIMQGYKLKRSPVLVAARRRRRCRCR